MERIIVSKLAYANHREGVSRVSAEVDGVPLWFESSHTELRLSPEGFGSILLVPAMSLGRDLVFEDPLCPEWLANARKLVNLFSDLLGWQPVNIESMDPDSSSGRVPGRKRALCFSGGVDSFYSLLTYPQPIDMLVLVHGYDIHLDDEEGARIAFEHVQRVAAGKKMDAAMIRTNARKHPIAGRKYRKAYGGALAAIGHLLDQVSDLVVSSGLPQWETGTYGSQCHIDPLWSSPVMKIDHYGGHVTKNEKIRVIAGNPLAHRHLRICQQNFYGSFELTGKALNCGCCPKCIRTLLVLQLEGHLDEFENFANKENLDFYLYRVMRVAPLFIKVYKEILRRGVDRKTGVAIHALIRRSEVLNRMEWAGRQGRKTVFQILRLYDAVERRICLRINR
ncbi:hypothetical protein Pcar_2906 [Syntrophotalea carbinolica DSM 2380]|uniref:Uncharacterized protein n=1 Tax=Syntrophotalea carbinolica (strain DSM 2380 / NBRC 103641 / GraBd1) TaxID=338963 RepID=Q3A0G6_SYNC1|nr:hypothetical protein [Syntrophotalea carbinolica]ABA90141.1 hypothetical protein Pcar_2906 [Syntrophotalea carbinolica DSM 2380]